MERTGRSVLPAAVEAARGRIEAWRRKRRHQREPMPEALWSTAVRLAGVHGINPISDALGLDYSRLKRRIVARSGSTKKKPAAPIFVDLGVGPIPGASGCIVELQADGDAKLTVRLPDQAALDLVSLAEILWRSRR